MSIASASENNRKLDEVKNDCWHNCDSDLDVDSVLQRVSQLQAQLEVQKALQKTERLLLQVPSDKALPNQQATRVKHLIKFVFEKTTRWKERQTQLRKLECDPLKVCGLTYTIKEIHELPSTQFEFLISNITDFRDPGQVFDPEEEAAFKEFLKKHIELRPSKRAKRTCDQRFSPNNHKGAEGGGQVNSVLTGDVYELTFEDLQILVISNQFQGQILLTDPYERSYSPFITIPISQDLKTQFATNRVRIM